MMKDFVGVNAVDSKVIEFVGWRIVDLEINFC